VVISYPLPSKPLNNVEEQEMGIHVGGRGFGPNPNLGTHILFSGEEFKDQLDGTRKPHLMAFECINVMMFLADFGVKNAVACSSQVVALLLHCKIVQTHPHAIII